MSFWELSIVIVVGLLVIGPERLPEAIKTVFRWVTKAKRTMNDMRTDFEHQIGADEIRRELRNEQIMENLEQLKSVRKDIEKTIKETDDSKQTLNAITHDTQAEKHLELSDDDFHEDDFHDDDYNHEDEHFEPSNQHTQKVKNDSEPQDSQIAKSVSNDMSLETDKQKAQPHS